MDFMSQVQSHLIAHQYEGLLEKAQLRGRKRTPDGKPAPRKGPALR
jgi:preprotein translocase subunit SecY